MTRALIPAWVAVQVLLVIILRIPPLSSGQDLRNNLPFPPLLIDLLRHLPRHTLLLSVVIENAASVLGARVWTLAVGSRRIVHFVEELEELAVGYLVGVKGYLKGFGICNTSQLASISCRGHRKTYGQCDQSIQHDS